MRTLCSLPVRHLVVNSSTRVDFSGLRYHFMVELSYRSTVSSAGPLVTDVAVTHKFDCAFSLGLSVRSVRRMKDCLLSLSHSRSTIRWRLGWCVRHWVVLCTRLIDPKYRACLSSFRFIIGGAFCSSPIYHKPEHARSLLMFVFSSHYCRITIIISFVSHLPWVLISLIL